MSNRFPSTFRVFVAGVAVILAAAMIITIVTGACFHWVMALGSILVLYRVIRR